MVSGKWQGDIHAKQASDNSRDGHDDSKGGQKLDSPVQFVGKQNLVRITQTLDALQIDLADLSRLPDADHHVIEQITILFFEFEIIAVEHSLKNIAHWYQG